MVGQTAGGSLNFQLLPRRRKVLDLGLWVSKAFGQNTTVWIRFQFRKTRDTGRELFLGVPAAESKSEKAAISASAA